MKQVTYDSLEEIHKKALEEAARVMETAYDPYSHFYVGAALYTATGQCFTGSNVNNAAYGPTICAERSAVARANAMGVRVFTGIAIIGQSEKGAITEVTAPCGVCRQVLFEFSQIAGHDLIVILSTTKMDKIVVTSIQELLPLAFGPADLEIDVSKYT